MQNLSSSTSPLTALQREMWIGQTMHPDAPLYNSAYTFHIKGEVDPELFLEAHRKLVLKTDSLRIVFNESNGSTLQSILGETDNEARYEDRSDLSKPEFETLLEERSLKIFDLSKRTWSSILYKRRNNLFVWLFVQHHMLIDGASFEIILNRLSTLYDAAAGQQISATPS
ncbi:MAG: condensation domain-containing protein, partial [Verrucomicrobiota bacterium]